MTPQTLLLHLLTEFPDAVIDRLESPGVAFRYRDRYFWIYPLGPKHGVPAAEDGWYLYVNGYDDSWDYMGRFTLDGAIRFVHKECECRPL